MKIIKRSGQEVDFNIDNITNAISKANKEVLDKDKLSEEEILDIAENIKQYAYEHKSILNVEDIQDLVEDGIMEKGKYQVAKKYIRYRYQRSLDRNNDTMDKRILSMIDQSNEDIKEENSNKNPTIVSTQRDYMAGEVSKEISRKYLIPKDVLDAHDEGIIHFHDMDYFAENLGNCCLVNMEDMLQNGTVISGTKIDKPHSFSTACNIATQIVAQVASSQYGGQTFTLSHLAPFVDVSRQKIKKELRESLEGVDISEEKFNKIVEDRVREEVSRGVQTIQYQILTLMTTNGQTPFVTVFMYLNEVDESLKDDLAMVIEEVIDQRYQGVKNECDVWITPSFPKLIYVLEEDNITPDSKYWYLTEKAARCTSKRLVPDYISEKIMKELKEGYTYPSMGCVDGEEIVTYKYSNQIYENDSFENMWNKFSKIFPIRHQFGDEENPNLYIDLQDTQITDTVKGWTKCNRIIRNISNEWVRVSLSGQDISKQLDVTTDHPFEVIGKGIVLAKDLELGDEMLVRDNHTVSVDNIEFYNSLKYSYDVSTDSEHFEVSGIYSHNCRSFLAPYYKEDGTAKFYGRFNMGVVTINLPYIGLMANKDFDKFWKIFDDYLELCYKALMCRYEHLKGTKSDVAPILWQYGGIARLQKGETIDKLLENGYASISLGYAGLCECVRAMTGKSHTDSEATPFALDIMKYMNKKVEEWKAKTGLGFSIYGTPIESTTYKFAKALQKRFGTIEGVSDKNYITNSYHVHVTEEIDAFSKLKFESQFQELSKGGAISYVEVPNMQNNIDAVLEVIQYIYDNIMYAELNTKSDYCQVCGWDGEIKIVKDDDGKLVWECPRCGNRDQSKMNVARRTCGYIGSNFWNQGRTQEIAERVLHL